MKIAILGTRGIPNEYGGFEEFAEFLSVGLVKLGHDVTVYNISSHTYKYNNFQKVKLKFINCPETKLGPFAHFIYDWNCTKDAVKNNYDIIYHAGYQSSAISLFFFNKKSNSIFVTNMDGLEWKRSKWSLPVKLLTILMEKIAVKYSDYLISDNIGIQNYFLKKYGIKSEHIAYGANYSDSFDEEILDKYSLIKNNYFFVLARFEPENNIECIINGVILSKTTTPLILIGNKNTRYGMYLTNKFSKYQNIKFFKSVYKKKELDSLRFFSKIYFHGHSVGGTNPSLLEAMACKCKIIAHNNEFNKSVLEEHSKYFKNSKDISKHILNFDEKNAIKNAEKLIEIIKRKYSWDKIINIHEDFFKKILK